MPASGVFNLPREALQAAGIEGSDRRPAGPSRAGPSLAAVVERARVHFAKATAIMAARPAPRSRTAADGRGLSQYPRFGWSSAAGRRPGARVRIDRRRLLWIVLPPTLFLMPGGSTLSARRAFCRLAAALRPLGRWREVVMHERPIMRRALPLVLRAGARYDDRTTAIHLLLTGNHAALDYLAQSARPTLSSTRGGGFRFRRPFTGERWPCASTTAVCPGGSSPSRRVPGAAS